MDGGGGMKVIWNQKRFRMKTAESYRNDCLQRQTELHRMLMSFNQYEQAMQLFMHQHAMLHSLKMADTEPWSFEDEVFRDLSEQQVKSIPPNSLHSIAWLVWHMARCEDITMNLLVAGSPQILNCGNWLEQMKITVCDTGNTMDEEDISVFSRTIDIKGLCAYRMAVGRRTREIVKKLLPQDLKLKVEPSRLQQVKNEGAVAEAANGIIDYWGKRNIAGLLLMPATRHHLIHLNEALKVKRRLQ
jgi:hypothetical protein